VQNYDWRDFFAKVGSQRHDEVLDILNHSANDDMIHCQHVILKSLEYDIVFLHLLLLIGHQYEIAFDVVDIDVKFIVVTFLLVEFGCNHSTL